MSTWLGLNLIANIWDLELLEDSRLFRLLSFFLKVFLKFLSNPRPFSLYIPISDKNIFGATCHAMQCLFMYNCAWMQCLSIKFIFRLDLFCHSFLGFIAPFAPVLFTNLLFWLAMLPLSFWKAFLSRCLFIVSQLSYARS